MEQKTVTVQDAVIPKKQSPQDVEEFTEEVKVIVTFTMQAVITLAGIGTSIYVILARPDLTNVFVPILSSLIAYWLPAPKVPIKVANGVTRAFKLRKPIK